jgi:hypothetical protein
MENIQEEVMNEINIVELNIIKDAIDKMVKINQVEILRILKKNPKINLNENNYGVHVNLSDLPSSIIQEIKNYINYVNTQEKNLNHIELQKNNMKNLFNVNTL